MEITLCGTKVLLFPTPTERLARVVAQIKSVMGELKEAGLTFENYNEPENLITLAEVLMSRCPSVLSDASDIDLDDIRRLPPGEILVLLKGVIDINVKDRENLTKNFQSLTGAIKGLTKAEPPKSK